MIKLEAQDEKFLANMLNGLTQRQSYRDAFPKCKKWTDKTVDEKASRLFNSDKCKTRWAELTKRLKKEVEDEGILSAKEVLQYIDDMLHVDIIDIAELVTRTVVIRDHKGNILYDEDGKPLTEYYQRMQFKDTKDMSKETRRAISEMGTNKHGPYIKLYNKQVTIEQAGKHLKLFTDKLEVEIKEMPKVTIGK